MRRGRRCSYADNLAHRLATTILPRQPSAAASLTVAAEATASGSSWNAACGGSSAASISTSARALPPFELWPGPVRSIARTSLLVGNRFAIEAHAIGACPGVNDPPPPCAVDVRPGPSAAPDSWWRAPSRRARVPGRALGDRLRNAPARRAKPSWYLVATDDHVIPPPAQRAMAERAGATVVEAPGSHSIYVSHPRATVDLIKRAAQGAGRTARYSLPRAACSRPRTKGALFCGARPVRPGQARDVPAGCAGVAAALRRRGYS